MDYKAAFIHTPKCAGTSTRELIKEYYRHEVAYLPDNRDPQWAKTANRNKTEYPDRWYFTKEDIGLFPFTFTFVRNPFSRLVSFWFYGKARNRAWVPWEMSFYNFVKVAASQNFDEGKGSTFAWSHIRPYTHENSIIFKDNLPTLDYIGKVENYRTDLEVVFEMLDLPSPPFQERERTTAHRHYTQYYNQESIDIVSNLYAADLEYFDYSYNT